MIMQKLLADLVGKRVKLISPMNDPFPIEVGSEGEVYNIGGGRELTNLEITHMILEAMGADESSIKYVEDRKGHDLRYSVDWTKINRELGYEPQVKFEDGLRDTIEWYRNNRAWWEPLKQRAGL